MNSDDIKITKTYQCVFSLQLKYKYLKLVNMDRDLHI